MEENKLLTHLAKITDFLEKSPIRPISTKVTMTINRDDFVDIFHIITNTTKNMVLEVPDSFSVKIGGVEYLFSLSSV